MRKICNCKRCGEEYLQRTLHHLYCSNECREAAKKERKQQAKQTNHPKVTIDQMVATSNRLSEELGRYVSYGEVQHMLMDGRINIGREKNDT